MSTLPPATVAATRPPTVAAHPYAPVARVLREGPAPLLEPVPGMAERDRLRLAFVIPPAPPGSGGLEIVAQLVLRLERRGHTCSLWMADPEGIRDAEWPATLRRRLVERVAPVRAPVLKDLERFYGADVAVATGWQTVFPTLALPACRARAYLLNDHEPEFHPASFERLVAEAGYRQGLFGLAGSAWLRALYAERYGGEAAGFDYGIDHATYRPREVPRDDDTVVLYARASTPRRAVPLGILALEELVRRRPGTRVVLFGDDRPLPVPFAHERLGPVRPEALAELYARATVGLCLSLTNYSLIPPEMLACGLPCVELDGPSTRAVYGEDGPVALAAAEPVALADAVRRLLDDPDERARRARAGLAFVAERTWERAAEQVEAGLRAALRAREAA